MTHQEHGLSIGISRINKNLFLNFCVTGKLTHEDYKIITPMIDDAVKNIDNPSIKVLVDLREFEGWEPRAAWDDFQLGIKYGRQFNKMAIVGNKTWEKMAASIGNWFTGGESAYFEDKESALLWLSDDGDDTAKSA